MTKNQRYLVTTGLKETWGDGEKIFLGKWCTQNINQEKSPTYEYLDYHWDDRNEFRKDYNNSIRIYQDFMPIIIQSLNKYHQTNYKREFWEVLIGDNIIKIIQVLYDRYKSISKALSKLENFSIIDLNITLKNVVPSDSYILYYLILTDEWNHIIYNSLIKSLDNENRIKFIKKESNIDIGKLSEEINKKTKSNSLLKKIMRKILSIYSKILIKNNKVIFYQSNISFRNQWLSEISHFQLPSKAIFDYINICENKVDYEFRKEKLRVNCKNKFEEFLSENILKLYQKTL